MVVDTKKISFNSWDLDLVYYIEDGNFTILVFNYVEEGYKFLTVIIKDKRIVYDVYTSDDITDVDYFLDDFESYKEMNSNKY